MLGLRALVFWGFVSFKVASACGGGGEGAKWKAQEVNPQPEREKVQGSGLVVPTASI